MDDYYKCWLVKQLYDQLDTDIILLIQLQLIPLSFVNEIRLLQIEKPMVRKENEIIIKENKFRDECLMLDEKALLELYDRYKEMLRRNCQQNFQRGSNLFVSHPPLGYAMIHHRSLTFDIKRQMKIYFDIDGFNANEGRAGPYTEGFYLTFK